MPILQVKVANKLAQGDGQAIVSDNSDYTVHFTFDAEWEPYADKTMRVVFPNGDYIEQDFTGNDCALPVLEDCNGIDIGVYAGDIHATVGAHYDVLRSIISGDGSECIPSEEFYAQLLNKEWGGN